MLLLERLSLIFLKFSILQLLLTPLVKVNGPFCYPCKRPLTFDELCSASYLGYLSICLIDLLQVESDQQLRVTDGGAHQSILINKSHRTLL